MHSPTTPTEAPGTRPRRSRSPTVTSRACSAARWHGPPGCRLQRSRFAWRSARWRSCCSPASACFRASPVASATRGATQSWAGRYGRACDGGRARRPRRSAASYPSDGSRRERASFGSAGSEPCKKSSQTTPTRKLLHGPPRQRARLAVCVLPPAHGREAHPDRRRELLLAHAQVLSQGTDVPRDVIHFTSPPTWGRSTVTPSAFLLALDVANACDVSPAAVAPAPVRQPAQARAQRDAVE